MKKELKPNSPNVSIEWIETGKNPEDLRDEPSVDLLFEERTTDFWRVISPYTGNIHHIVWLIIGCRIVFGIFVCLRFWIFCWLSFPVPFALYLQQFGTRTCHFAWYLLHFGMVTLHFAWYLLHVAMFAFHFAWYLSHFGVSTSHLHGICYILVLQTFMWVSWGFFRLSFRVSFKVSFRVSFRALFRASFGVYLGFHLGFL